MAARTGLSEAAAARAIDAILGTITDALRQGQGVNFTGFGKFSAQHRTERQGVNPRNPSQRVTIPVSTVPKFSAGSSLKQAIRSGGSESGNGGGGDYSAPAPASRSSTLRATGQHRPRRPAPPASEKRINAWITGRGGRRRSTPLHVRETYDLNVNVGAPVGSSAVEGDAAIDPSTLPVEGLDTEWVVTAKHLELGATPGEQGIEVVPGNAKEPWTARFQLHIPKIGDSPTRVLTVTPRRASAGRIDLLVLVDGELYRQVVVNLDVSGRGQHPARRRAGSAEVERDLVQTPGLHTRLRPTHEWTTPPGRLGVIVQPPNAYVSGSAGGLAVDARTPWYATQASVAGPITNVRAAAERFRARWSDYLNDIDSVELVERLDSVPRPYWGAAPEPATSRHERTWRAARKSPELRELAYYGRLLYDAFFPTGSDLRTWIDLLQPGHRLDVSWQDLDPGWVPSVPWGLMYTGEPKPVDPMSFLALRLRIGYSAHGVQAGSKALGDPARVYGSNLLYWGSGRADDATAAEAVWQRDQWSAWKNQLFWPSSRDVRDPKREVVRALARPSPSPVGVLYLYCESNFGARRDDPVLAFADPAGTTAALSRTDLGLKPLRDRPLVFANACTTSAGDPYVANDLEQRFFQRGCRAFLGTETLVPIQLASRFARIFFHFFYRKADPAPMAAGEAVAQARRFLWHNYLNIGGIFYTYVNQYELFLADDDEVVALRA